MRELLPRCLTGVTIVAWAVILYYAITQQLPRALLGVIFLGMVVVVYILSELPESIEDGAWLDISLLLGSGMITTVASAYIAVNYEVLYTVRVGYSFWYEYVLAAALVIAITYLTWREFGAVIPVMVFGAIAYGYFGASIPGVLGHGGLSGRRMLQILVLDIGGVYGTLTRLIAAWVALFLLYAGLMEGYGVFKLIQRGAIKAATFSKSGVAQAAVISSAIVGSINGSRTANAAMTGSFTIPMMKRSGLRPKTAAGIESVASTLGQVLPPVMGASAFLMAAFLGITYVNVMIAAIVPAVIMILSIVISVHYVAVHEIDDPNMESSELITGETEDRVTGRRDLTIEVLKYLIPFAILVYCLGIVQYTIPTSALYTCLAMFATGIGFPVAQTAYDHGPTTAVPKIKELLGETIEGARSGMITLAPIAIIAASINAVIDILISTGVPSKLSLLLLSLSGGVLLIAALLSMAICIILGLGMPTVAAYTVVALLVAPSLINTFFLPELSAHFFVFYGAVISGITPPVAIVCAVTAGMARARFLSTCLMSVRIFGPLFILPFSFIYHPEIVSGNLGGATWLSAVVILLGALGISHGVNYDISSNPVIRYPTTLVYIVLGAVSMVHPALIIQGGALVLIGILWIIQTRTEILSIGQQSISDDSAESAE